ncbi:MAG: NAD(P)/FAD-dependent oxidoreductase, partial [Cyanobacteria bacterium J083]
LELAYILNKLGKKITFVWLNNDFLVQEDKEIAELIQADLEASGIKIYSNLKLNSIETWQGKKRVIFNQRKITCDEIILACGEKAYLASLNLAKAEVKIDDQGIVVNQYLQTSNRRIYAFGGVIGGYNYTQIGQYEASIVLQNCLFKSHATVNYYAVPWAMFTQPNLARVGMNERQANKFYRQNILITKKMFNHNPWSIATNQTTGICKLISTEDGIILGASIIGNNGIELINLVAEIMQKSLRLETNSLRDILTSPPLFVYPSFCQILAQAQLNLTKQKLLLNKKKKQTFEQLWQWIKD